MNGKSRIFLNILENPHKIQKLFTINLDTLIIRSILANNQIKSLIEARLTRVIPQNRPESGSERGGRRGDTDVPASVFAGPTGKTRRTVAERRRAVMTKTGLLRPVRSVMMEIMAVFFGEFTVSERKTPKCSSTPSGASSPRLSPLRWR